MHRAAQSLVPAASLLILVLSGVAQADPTPTPLPQKDRMAAYRAAMEAYGRKDYPAYLEHFKILMSGGTKNPYLMYSYAGAHALAGDPDEAFDWLARLAALGLGYKIAENADLARLRELPRFRELEKAFEANRVPAGSGEAAFTLPEKDLIAEGITYDPKEKVFYVGSIYRRKVLAVDREGRVKDFTTEGQDGLWGVLGLKVDPERRLLWVCSAAGPESQGAKGNAGLFKYELATGKLIQKYVLAPAEGLEHLLNDIAFDAEGNLYVTDSTAGAVYRLDAARDELEPFVAPGSLVYPNGIVLVPGGPLLVADGGGLVRVDLATKELKRLEAAEGILAVGIDGLALHEGGLIGVQNGLEPHRVVRLTLNAAWDKIERLSVVESNHPLFVIPTTGVVAEGAFYTVANSQLEALGDDGKFKDPAALQPTVILKSRL